MYVIQCSRKKIRAVEGQCFIAGVRVSQVHTMLKNMQKRAKPAKSCISSTYLSKNVYLKVSYTRKRAKTCKNVNKTCKNVQKRASQMFLDPIQKRALSRSVHLEAVYLEALLYSLMAWNFQIGTLQVWSYRKFSVILWLENISFPIILARMNFVSLEWLSREKKPHAISKITSSLLLQIIWRIYLWAFL